MLPAEIEMEPILKNLAAPALIEAIEANYLRFWRKLAQLTRAEWHEEPNLLYVTAPWTHTVLRARFSAGRSR